MKKVTIRAPEPKPEAEKAKRIYRAALDIIKRHDGIYKQKKAYRDVFLPEAIMLRDRLQEYCEKLLFYCSLEYGRKAEELLWRKVFYEIIQLMKHNRKHMIPSSSLESAFRTHLASAIGYYHHLLCRLQSEYDLSLESVVDFYYFPESKTHRKPHHTSKVEPLPESQHWATECCHRCLVYLGDLARYQHDYNGLPSRILSQRYYFQAYALCPELGMPHNQLGTLAGTSFYGLDAAYYYIRCLVSPSSFEGAHGNLIRLFERNRRRYQELDQLLQRGLMPEQQRSKDVKRFVIRVLHLIDVFYSQSQQSIDMKGIQEVCQNALHDFNLCMFSQPADLATAGSPIVTDSSSTNNHTGDEKPGHLPDEIVFKIIVICLAMIHIMQKDGNKLVAAAIAFSLALFSHILNHVTVRLQSALYDIENPRRVLKLPSSDELNGSADADEVTDTSFNRVKRKSSVKKKPHHLVSRHDSAKNDTESNDKKKSKKVVAKQLSNRRRRRRGSDSESNSGGSGSDDVSEGEMSESDTENVKLNGSYTTSPSNSSSGLSDTDSDDALMISQELRPGFSDTVRRDSSQHRPVIASGVDANDDREGLLAKNATKTKSHRDVAFDSSNVCRTPVFESLPPGGGIRGDSMPDVAEYLREIPLDWLSDAANLLSQTLRFGMNFETLIDSNATSAVHHNDNSKPVRIPPGFEKSSEIHHVMEIRDKLANFDIDTDTDASVYPTDAENSTVTESEMDTEVETDKESIIDRSEVEAKRLERVVELASNETLLCSVKVYCDWMLVNPHIIATCAKISSSLWYRLAVLLNFLPAELDIAQLEIFTGYNKIERVLKSVPLPSPKDVSLSAMSDANFEKITVPLTEDSHLRKFPPLEAALKDLNFGCHKELSFQQEAMLRVCCIRRFGYFISRMKSVSFSYDANSATFIGPQQAPPSEQSVDERQADQKLANDEARRNQLMRDMAQLRLRAEVTQLEGSLQQQAGPDSPSSAAKASSSSSSGGGDRTDSGGTPRGSADLPPYLVPDAPTLCEHLSQVKQLAASSRFIIIIPLTVIDHLDLLKKENAGAREAIRWLETEFQKGNRYVRAQKLHEKMQPSSQPKVKKDKEAVRFASIFDCCRYLGQQRATQASSSSIGVDLRTMVCLLTRLRIINQDLSTSTKELLAEAQAQGLTMQPVTELYARWKEVWKADKG